LLIAIAILGGLIVAGLLAWAYKSGAQWTGFVGSTHPKSENQEYVPGKTLWDWLQLLLIPATLSAGVLLFNTWEGNRQRERTERQAHADRQAAMKQAHVDRQVAINDQRERALQAVLDEMSDLIIDKGLRQSKAGSNLRIVARTRALSTLRGLDGPRRGTLIRFLSESKLLERPDPVVNLRRADLSGAFLGSVDLRNAYLRDVTLYRAELSDADLRWADLTGANLERTCMPHARLDHSVLDDAFFTNAYMYDVSLNGAGTKKREYDDPEKGAPPGWRVLGVDFGSSYLADVTGADTKLAAGNFNDAYISDETRIEGADLSGAQTLPPKQDSAVVDKQWGYCFSEERIQD
jgi:uncharacterized protein YjbI with pentapeptide repeats